MILIRIIDVSDAIAGSANCGWNERLHFLTSRYMIHLVRQPIYFKVLPMILAYLAGVFCALAPSVIVQGVLISS